MHDEIQIRDLDLKVRITVGLAGNYGSIGWAVKLRIISDVA